MRTAEYQFREEFQPNFYDWEEINMIDELTEDELDEMFSTNQDTDQDTADPSASLRTGFDDIPF